MTSPHLNSVPEPELGWDIDALNIWSGTKPRWWANVPLRDFLTVMHGQTNVAEVERQAVERFGAGVPSKSALHRYYDLLTEVLGCEARHYEPQVDAAAKVHHLPIALVRAEAALNALSQEQRLAMAIRIAATTEGDEHCMTLMRLGKVASDIGAELMVRKFEREAV